MQIEFRRKEALTGPGVIGKSQKGLPVIHRITFCCEEMVDKIIQKYCYLPTDTVNKIWFSYLLFEFGCDNYVRFCPFCGEKVEKVEITAEV